MRLMRELNQDFFEGNGIVDVAPSYGDHGPRVFIRPPEDLGRRYRIWLALSPTTIGYNLEVFGRNGAPAWGEGCIRQTVGRPGDLGDVMVAMITALLTDD